MIVIIIIIVTLFCNTPNVRAKPLSGLVPPYTCVVR